jgi:hypothetical protein
MHGPDELLRRRLAVQQVQKVPAERVIVGLNLDPLAVMGVMVPVE